MWREIEKRQKGNRNRILCQEKMDFLMDCHSELFGSADDALGETVKKKSYLGKEGDCGNRDWRSQIRGD